MPSLLSWLTLASIPALALASPVRTETVSPLQPRGTRHDIDALNNEFLGISWDDVTDTCSDDDIDIIIQSTRKAIDMMAFAVDVGGITDSAAWNRYFVKDFAGLSSTWATNFDLWEHVIRNLGLVRKYPTNGKLNRNGERTRTTKVAYRCPQPKKDLCEDQAAGQVTHDVDPLSDNWNHVINLCPIFFKNMYNIDSWKNSKNPSSMASLVARETAVIHEFMHVNVIGFKKLSKDTGSANIADMEGESPIFPDKASVYGDSRLHDWAWKHIEGTGNDITGKINVDTAVNADTYAFLFTYHWLHQNNGWQTDGSETYVRKQNKKADDVVTYGGDGIDEDSVVLDNVESPDECQKGANGAPECFYNDKAGQSLAGHVGVGNTPEVCDPNDSSGLPTEVFKGMYGHFCESIETAKSIDLGRWWFVDNKGLKIVNRRRGLDKRSPPVSTSSFPKARSYLSFEKDGDKACKMSCSEAFDTLIQGSCGRAGGTQSAMAEKGHIDAGCGAYSFMAYSGIDDSNPTTPSGLDPDNN